MTFEERIRQLSASQLVRLRTATVIRSILLREIKPIVRTADADERAAAFSEAAAENKRREKLVRREIDTLTLSGSEATTQSYEEMMAELEAIDKEETH